MQDRGRAWTARRVSDLDRRRAELQTTLLRIEGAIQVLQEVLAQETPAG